MSEQTDRLKASAKRLVRQGVDRMPDKARQAVLAAAAAARVEPPSERAFDFPDDVRDRAALRDYLADTDIFGPAASEAEGYLNDALDRFRITMALLPDLAPGARVLELGSNPYFLTRLLLKRGYKVTSANYFGDTFTAEPVQVVTGPRSGERHVFEFDHFNIEREPFPYDDGAFDLVLFCEILEHLPFDPIHTLAEIHRVLAKPHGRMVLTTPNATRTSNLLRIVAGENPYEELSGYGTYGRHNREYTVRELRTLLDSLSFEVEDVFAADIHDDAPAVPALPGLDPADRGDNLFAVARPVGEPRWHYPRWLYSSQHALRRMVSADVRAGHNDELQATGLHEAERLADGWGCWTAQEEVCFDLAPPAEGDPADPVVVIEGIAPPPAATGGQPLVVTVRVGDASSDHEVAPDEPFVLRVPARPAWGQAAVIVRSATWSPAQVGRGEDRRTLGWIVRRVTAESV